MSAWFAQMLGDYSYQFFVLFVNQLQFVASAVFFCLELRRKPYFVLRLLAGFLAGNVILGFAVWLRTDWDSLLIRTIVTTLQYAYTLPLMLLCFDEDLSLLLKSWCAGIAVKEIVGTVYPVLQVILGYDPHATNQLLPLDSASFADLHWTVYHLVHFSLYFLLWLLIRKHLSRESMEKDSRRQAVWLSVSALLILGVLGSVTSHYRDESLVLYICSRAFARTVAVFILLTSAGLEFRSKASEDIAVMEHVLAEERKQFVQLKENIDIINMRCHDLKHQLVDYSDRLTDREISELQEAMDIYDRNIRTGSEALDVVLYLHQLTCKEEGIIFTCLADGAALSFMRTRHIYGLFNNAIGNALEAVRKVRDPEKRVIGLTVCAEDGTVEIEVTNYYEGELRSEDGKMLTTKADARHHGFGTMSMNYIVRQYHGATESHARNGIYTFHASVPIPGQAARA